MDYPTLKNLTYIIGYKPVERYRTANTLNNLLYDNERLEERIIKLKATEWYNVQDLPPCPSWDW